MTEGIENGPHEHHLETISLHEFTERREQLSEAIDIPSLRNDGQSKEDLVRQRDDLDCSHPNHYLQLVEAQRIELGEVNLNN